MSWDDVSFVMASKNRRTLILLLQIPKTPTILAKNTKMNLANVSRTLSDLDRQGLVECLTPRKKVGRIYSLTAKGVKVVEKIRNIE